jgi:hypothetical protein
MKGEYGAVEIGFVRDTELGFQLVLGLLKGGSIEHHNFSMLSIFSISQGRKGHDNPVVA